MEISTTLSASSARFAPPPREPKAEHAAREFEAVMVAELLKPMLDSVKAPAIVGGGGEAEAAFSNLLREEIAKSVVAHGGFGIAEKVKAELLRMQAVDASEIPGRAR